MTLDETLRPWFDVLAPALGAARLLDVHTHIGCNDTDGFRSAPGELVAALARADARGIVFPMQEPNGYRVANDAVLEAARADPDRLIPFCRVDPSDGAVAEAERALTAGARGVKLHPRAEAFALSHPAVEGLLALCAERRAPVLIHAGRGIPALGTDALELAERFPGAPIILAHAGISDLSWIWRHAGEHPSLFFDTSWWNPADLLALFTLLPPGRILFGSDAPYASPLQGAVTTLRCALQAGLSGAQVASVMGDQARRLAAWESPLAASAPVGPAQLPSDVLCQRLWTLLAVATGRLLRDGHADEELALARLACEVGDDAPQARVCRSVLALLDERDRRVAEPDADALTGTHEVAVGAVVAATPDVPVPDPPATADVGERERGR